MYCYRKVKDDLYWVGGNDTVERCVVSYNSYLLLDEKTVLFDTVDHAVEKVFFENIEHLLAGRKLDYVVVHHMEPDHSASLRELVMRYPEVKVICNAKIAGDDPPVFRFRHRFKSLSCRRGRYVFVRASYACLCDGADGPLAGGYGEL